MTKPRLTDLQSVLLSAALRREHGDLLPAPTSVAGKDDDVHKALGQLLKRGFVTETDQPPSGTEWRVDGDARYGLTLSELGRTAIGAAGDEVDDAATSDAVLPAGVDRAPSNGPRPGTAPTKTAVVIAMLGRKKGATLPELVDATGWLPHTTRAALTGLRKKGHELNRGKRGDVTCYTIAKAKA